MRKSIHLSFYVQVMNLSKEAERAILRWKVIPKNQIKVSAFQLKSSGSCAFVDQTHLV